MMIIDKSSNFNDKLKHKKKLKPVSGRHCQVTLFALEIEGYYKNK